MKSEKYTEIYLFKRLMRIARPFWPHIAGIFLISLLATPIALITPLPLKILVDNVLGSQPLPWFLEFFPASFPNGYLILAIVLSVVIALLIQLQSLATWLLSTYTGEKLLLEFRARLFRHLQRLSLAYHDKTGTADSMYRVQYDAYAIQNLTISGLIPFITSILTLVGMVYVTALIDWQLAVIALGIIPVLYWLTHIYKKSLRDGWSKIKKIESTNMSIVQEALTAMRVIKAFGTEEHEESRFIRNSDKGLKGQVKMAFSQGSFDLWLGLTIALGMSATLLVGTLHVQSGILTLGELLMVTAYLTQIYKPMESIGKNIAKLQFSFASAERAFTLLDETPDVTERPNARSIERVRGDFSVQNISFSYMEGRPAIHNISFEVAAGTRVGIFGTTGAGKTTLFSLITRFYDPTEGRILLDGVDLRDYRLADLRNQYTIMLQETFLFSTDIAQNIAYARPDAGKDEIIEAAKAANAHDFIMNLPNGYQTEIGERGILLSGGERQRISLARAFLKNAPVLMLDEPTSSIDTKTEEAIMEAMERLMQGRTTFIIAHRLSTLRSCDICLEIENGRLVEKKLGSAEGRQFELITPAAP